MCVCCVSSALSHLSAPLQAGRCMCPNSLMTPMMAVAAPMPTSTEPSPNSPPRKSHCSPVFARHLTDPSRAVSLHLTGKWSRISLCVGCGSEIYDQYILRVHPDLEWHAACLKCADCHQYLDESCTCFVREGKTYCKRDYLK